MQEGVTETQEMDSNSPSEEELRAEMYEELNVTKKERAVIEKILPRLEWLVQTESRYDIDTRSKILAEISLARAYVQEPKGKLLVSIAGLIGVYDYLHAMEVGVYPVLLGAFVSLYGLAVSLRSAPMMAVELEGLKDGDGMPADYKTKALSSVTTNASLLRFSIVLGIQLLVVGSFIQGELLTANVADGMVYPGISAFILFITPIALLLLRRQ
ncbi:hypothetical protein HTG_04555 [Natrinema mahii]|nr:hypothetical protein HTG_04555 [Natrinema mahii]